MDFFQKIIDFCNSNIVLTAVVAFLTTAALIIDKTTKIFEPIKKSISNYTKRKQERKKKNDEVYEIVKASLDKIGVIDARLDCEDHLTADIQRNLQQLNERLGDLQEKVYMNEKDRLKSEIYTYGNRCRRGMHLYLDEYRHICEVWDKYHNALHGNSDGAREFEFIVEYFNEQEHERIHGAEHHEE